MLYCSNGQSASPSPSPVHNALACPSQGEESANLPLSSSSGATAAGALPLISSAGAAVVKGFGQQQHGGEKEGCSLTFPTDFTSRIQGLNQKPLFVALFGQQYI